MCVCVCVCVYRRGGGGEGGGHATSVLYSVKLCSIKFQRGTGLSSRMPQQTKLTSLSLFFSVNSVCCVCSKQEKPTQSSSQVIKYLWPYRQPKIPCFQFSKAIGSMDKRMPCQERSPCKTGVRFAAFPYNILSMKSKGAILHEHV